MNNGDKPAYPVTLDWDNVQKKVITTTVKPGLSKREMFAMAAMQGLCANPNVSADKSKSDVAQFYASVAIKFADELLKQLES
jgi:hypothetical protein